MTKSEFIALRRKENPEYDDLSDETFFTKWMKKYPQDMALIDQSKLDHTSSDSIKNLKRVSEPFFLGIDRQSRLDALRRQESQTQHQIAIDRVGIEKTYGEAIKQEIKNTQAEREAGMEMMVTEALHENAYVIAKAATDKSIPVADYTELKKEEMRLEAAYRNKKLEMELEVQKAALEVRHLVELKWMNTDQNYRLASQLLQMIEQVHLELVAIRDSNKPAEVKQKQLELRGRNLDILEKQYNERLEQISLGEVSE